MNSYRLILLGLAAFLFFHGIRGIKNGATPRKGGGMIYRSESPFWFWFNIVSILIFGVMLIYYAFFGRFR